jgi:serine/threonine-protein kinase
VTEEDEQDRFNDSGLQIGTLIASRFRIERKLGEGGMGAVYAATNVATNRPVALKVMHPEYAAKKDIVRRFMREAKAATVIKHPNVIEVFDVVSSDTGEPIIVMELLEGQPLDALLEKRGLLSLGEVCRIMLPVVSAVGAAHGKGIVHRDLKPENIFLSNGPNGSMQPKVLDFGIAKVLDPTQINEGVTKSNSTRTGSMLGTPHFMSMEQACGEKDIDHRTDTWSIGVILYVMLTGRRPYDGENFGQILRALMTTSPTPIQQFIPNLPDDITDLVDRCMRRNRNERPKDLREVYTILSHHCDDVTVHGPPSLAAPLRAIDIASSATLAAGSVYLSNPGGTSPILKRPNRLIIAIAAPLFLLGMGTTIFWMSARKTQSSITAATDPTIAPTASLAALSPSPNQSAGAISLMPEPAAPSASASTAVVPVPAKGKGKSKSPETPAIPNDSPKPAKPAGGGFIESDPYK